MFILTFIRLWRDIVCNSMLTLGKQSYLKITFVFLCSAGFLTAEFFICRAAFLFIKGFPGIGPIMIERLMYLFYFAVFLMLIFSNAIITYSTVYRAGDTGLLFTYPLSQGIIFRFKFFESLTLSSWAFIVLLIPFMVSYGMVNNADKLSYPFLIIFFIPFLIVSGTIGSAITISLVRIMHGKRLRRVTISIGLLVVFFLYLAIKRFRIEEGNQTMEIFLLNKMLPNVRLSHSPFWPSCWLAEGVLRAARGDFKGACFYLLLILSTSLFFMELLACLASHFYRDGWIEMRSQAKERLFRINRGIIERSRIVFRLFGRGSLGLITKDMKLFWRDAGQWSQFLIFFGLLGVYFLNIRNFSYNLLAPFWKNICAFLNLTATLLTLGSLATRFIFPQISMEGNKFWIVGMAPLGFRKLLYQKFWTSVIVLLVITEALIIISNNMLGISGMMMYSSIWVVFIMNFALVGLSLGLGAGFPDFKSANPAAIVSGFGGTLTLMLSIIFILAAVFLMILPFQLFLKGYISTYQGLRGAAAISMGIVFLIGMALCIAPLLYGERRLKAAEF